MSGSPLPRGSRMVQRGLQVFLCTVRGVVRMTVPPNDSFGLHPPEGAHDLGRGLSVRIRDGNQFGHGIPPWSTTCRRAGSRGGAGRT